jgi:hypothetical protein
MRFFFVNSRRAGGPAAHAAERSDVRAADGERSGKQSSKKHGK